MWKIITYRKVEQGLIRYKSDKTLMKKFQTIKNELINSKDPRELGERKHGKWKYAYGIRVNQSIRLLYNVDFENHVIILIGFGDHKIY